MQDPHPGRHVHHIDFNHFRTIGMRREVGEAAKRRFVTGDRLENVLKVRNSSFSDGASTSLVLRSAQTCCHSERRSTWMGL